MSVFPLLARIICHIIFSLSCEVAKLEGVSEASVQRAVHIVCNAITSVLGPLAVKFPSTRQELVAVAAGFHQLGEFVFSYSPL